MTRLDPLSFAEAHAQVVARAEALSERLKRKPKDILRPISSLLKDDAWPQNAANPWHTVDPRQPWVESPELRARELSQAHRLPDAHAHAHAHPLPGSTSAYLSSYDHDRDHERGPYECARCSSAPAPAPVQAPAPAPARARSARTYGGEENQSRQRPTASASGSGSVRTHDGDEPCPCHCPSFTQRETWTRTRPRTGTAAATRTPAHAPPMGMGVPRAQAREGNRKDNRNHAHAYNRGRERGQDRERERERPQSWLGTLLNPKKLFRRSRIVADGEDAADGLDCSRKADVEDEEEDEAEAEAEDEAAHSEHPVEVTPKQWRAYGAWARPRLGRPWEMIVHNATPPDSPTAPLSLLQAEAMFASLYSPDGTRHPENWVARTEHPSLPPRPALWPTPPPTYDPLPTELQLNPFLAHRVRGRPAIHFDLRMRTVDILLYGPAEDRDSPFQFPPLPVPLPIVPGVTFDNTNSIRSTTSTGSTGQRYRRMDGKVDFWVDGPDGAQPATYPGVTSLRITALAEDWRHELRWPITVFSRHEALPVSVKDVLNALVANFEERLWHEEVNEMSGTRCALMHAAYWRRLALEVGGEKPPPDDGLRRVDYLGDAVYFRGLAPAPDGKGFMLYTGPPP